MATQHRDAGTDISESATITPPTDRAGIAPSKLVLLIVGVGLLIASALSLSRLAEWADRWGQVPVFLAFFIVMSLAGRWFWGGIDAIVARIKGQ